MKNNFVLNEGYNQHRKNFFSKAEKDFVYNTKGKKFIDLGFCSGANLLGHNSAIEKKIYKNYIKKKISNFSAPNKYAADFAFNIKKTLPGFSKFIFCNSGSEANLKAIRICRAITNKDKIVNVTGSWHGAADQFLFGSDKNLKIFKLSDGIPKEARKNLVFIPYNDIEVSRKILDKIKKEISCIMIEPIQGCLPDISAINYLKFLESYAKKNKIILFFDEIITGLRTNGSSVQDYFKIKTDISTFGKAFGNGIPLGFIGISKNIEKIIKKKKLKIYFGGTFSGNSLSMFCSNEFLKFVIKNKKKIFLNLKEKTSFFEEKVNNFCKKNNLDVKVYSFFSMFRIIYSSKTIKNRYQRDFFESRQDSNIKKFKKYLYLNKIYQPKNGIMFFSYISSKKNIKFVADKFNIGLKKYFA
jgi:glutamate-1-semialdehyde 2,1-aminomutase